MITAVKKNKTQTLAVVGVEYLNDYILKLTFSDGHINTVDFGKFIRNERNPMITKYADIDNFKQYKIEDGDLMWNDFEMCFTLKDLYKRKTM
jgi:hypothetical protein